MREPHRITTRERPQRFRQLIGARHLCLANQHWDHALVLRQRAFNLDPDKVARVVQPPAAATIARVDPVPANHRNEHVALRDLIVQNADEVEPGLDAVDVYKQLLGREGLLQAREQRLRRSGIVASTIVDENLAGHLFRESRGTP